MSTRTEMTDLFSDDIVRELLDVAAEGSEIGSEERTVLDRLHVETLGILPFALHPVEPPASVKEKIMAKTAAAAAPSAEVVEFEPAPVSLDSVEDHPPVRRRSWALPLAATLAALLFGVTAWQQMELKSRELAIARLTQDLSQAESRVGELALAVDQIQTVQSRLNVVTTAGTEICPLKPAGENPLFAAARGTLFVAADHQHWYLAVEGLEDAVAGQAYQVWFHIDGQPVGAGALERDAGGRMIITSETMPSGMQAISVTLETSEAVVRPAGPPVLYGDEVVMIL